MRQYFTETIASMAEITDAMVRAGKAGRIRKNPRTESSGEGQRVGGGQRKGSNVPCWRVGEQLIVTGRSF